MPLINTITLRQNSPVGFTDTPVGISNKNDLVSNDEMDSNFLLFYNDTQRRILKTGDTISGDYIVTSGSIDIQNGQLKIESAVLDTSTVVTTTTDPDQIIASISSSAYSTVKFFVQAKFNGEIHSTEVLSITDGTNVLSTEYAVLTLPSNLATFNVVMNGSAMQLVATPFNANTTFRVNYLGVAA